MRLRGPTCSHPRSCDLSGSKAQGGWVRKSLAHQLPRPATPQLGRRAPPHAVAHTRRTHKRRPRQPTSSSPHAGSARTASRNVRGGHNLVQRDGSASRVACPSPHRVRPSTHSMHRCAAEAATLLLLRLLLLTPVAPCCLPHAVWQPRAPLLAPWAIAASRAPLAAARAGHPPHLLIARTAHPCPAAST